MGWSGKVTPGKEPRGRSSARIEPALVLNVHIIVGGFSKILRPLSCVEVTVEVTGP